MKQEKVGIAFSPCCLEFETEQAYRKETEQAYRNFIDAYYSKSDEFCHTRNDAHNDSLKLVIDSFSRFLSDYKAFNDENNIANNIDNAYEITTSLSDKVGRICRQVKHKERNDPKPDWPDGISSDMMGVIVYLIILKNKYNIDIEKGFETELKKAIEQHKK